MHVEAFNNTTQTDSQKASQNEKQVLGVFEGRIWKVFECYLGLQQADKKLLH